jgi:hypothetical protein
VKTDGNLMQTGQNESYATPVKASANALITDAVQLALGGRHACYVNTSGVVYCWGANIGGALGNGSETASLYPVRAGALTGVSKVVAGPDVSCALVGSGADAGRVYCWGSSGYLTLGIGDPSQNTDGCINYCKTSPIRVRVDANTYLAGVVDIAAGYQTTCVLRNDKSLWCWGTSGGSYASLIQAPSGTPVTDVAAIGVSSGQPRVLLTDGTYWGIDGNQRTLLDVGCGLLD